MSALFFLVASVVLLALLVGIPCVVVTLGLLTVGDHRHQPWRYFGSYRNMIWLLFLNAMVLAPFCGLWYWGVFMSDYWMHIIDEGAPWSWFIALSIASYIATLLRLRKHSKVFFTSLLGPVITAPAFCLWVAFCAVKFDPFF